MARRAEVDVDRVELAGERFCLAFQANTKRVGLTCVRRGTLAKASHQVQEGDHRAESVDQKRKAISGSAQEG